MQQGIQLAEQHSDEDKVTCQKSSSLKQREDREIMEWAATAKEPSGGSGIGHGPRSGEEVSWKAEERVEVR